MLICTLSHFILMVTYEKDTISLHFTDEATGALRDNLQERCSLEVMEVGLESSLTGPQADAFSPNSIQFITHSSDLTKAACIGVFRQTGKSGTASKLWLSLPMAAPKLGLLEHGPSLLHPYTPIPNTAPILQDGS